MPPVGFEPVVPVIERPHTHALDGSAVGICAEEVVQYFWRRSSSRKAKLVSELRLIRSDASSVMWESLDWSWRWAFLNNYSASFDVPRLNLKGFNGWDVYSQAPHSWDMASIPVVHDDFVAGEIPVRSSVFFGHHPHSPYTYFCHRPPALYNSSRWRHH
jgi:hypothetical protein